MMSAIRYKNDDSGIAQMIQDIRYELYARTIDRLSSDVATELATSAQEFLEAQPLEKREVLRQPVNEIAAEVARQITDQMSNNEEESTHE